MENEKKELEEISYGVDEELKKASESKIVKKELFTTKESVLIKGVKKNRFGKYALSILGSTDAKTGDITISNKDYNMMLEKFGTKAGDWLNKKVFLTAVEFEGNPDLNMSSGYTIQVTFS